MHIRAYTVYVHICPYKRIMLKYTYIYVHIRSLKPYWILKFLHVCAYVFARICTYLRTYLQVYASMCNYTYIDAPNNFPYKKYVHIRAIRANTCKYGTIYVQHTCIYVLHFCANTCTYGRSYVHVLQVCASICMYIARIRVRM